jgi:hypothetical protein
MAYSKVLDNGDKAICPTRFAGLRQDTRAICGRPKTPIKSDINSGVGETTMTTIKQSKPPEGFTFTHVEKHILESLHIPYREVVTDWIRGGHGHFNPIITRVIPAFEVERSELNQRCYNRMTNRRK